MNIKESILIEQLKFFLELARNTCLTSDCYIEFGFVHEMKMLLPRLGGRYCKAAWTNFKKRLPKYWWKIYFRSPDEYEYLWEYEGIESLKKYVSSGALTLDRACDSPNSVSIQEYILNMSSYYNHNELDYADYSEDDDYWEELRIAQDHALFWADEDY